MAAFTNSISTFTEALNAISGLIIALAAALPAINYALKRAKSSHLNQMPAAV